MTPAPNGLSGRQWMQMGWHAGTRMRLKDTTSTGTLPVNVASVPSKFSVYPLMLLTGSTVASNARRSLINNKIGGHYGPLSFLLLCSGAYLCVHRMLPPDRPRPQCCAQYTQFHCRVVQTRSPVTAVMTVKPAISSRLLLFL